MDASTALSQSMRHITAAKLASLSKRREDFETKVKLLRQTVVDITSPAEKVFELLKGFPLPDTQTSSTDLSTQNIQRFLDQYRYDPSISPSLIKGWQTKLEDALDVQSAKFEYATLFGKLVTEWLENPNDAAAAAGGLSQVIADRSDGEPHDSFEKVGRTEMHEQRQQWEAIVLQESKSDPAAITPYLHELFGTASKAKKVTKSPLENLRQQMSPVDDTHIGRFNIQVLKQTIKSLVKTDLLSEHKKTLLGEFGRNELVLTEIADVLNMQLDALDSWSWGSEAIPLEMRRNLNGKYRIYMDEEVLQAVFLHYVGLRWAVHFRLVFKDFFHSGAWRQNSRNALDKKARQRRETFINSEPKVDSVRKQRREMYQEYFFLNQLPLSIGEGARDYPEVEKSHQNDNTARVNSKQLMLRLVTTESLINRRLHGSFTILQTDFKWFGPSLPHSTISAVLEFLGVPLKWLKFFHAFLKTPMRFIHDGPSKEWHFRQRGVPISHALSDALSEAVLFCLDYAVNQSTQSNLYRFYDDLWFWGQDDTCVKAWRAITDFVRVMGLSLNEKKTGAVRISEKSATSAPLPKALPQGRIRLGFLHLDQGGDWLVDDDMVDQHIQELSRQLCACKSLFAWIQAWNRYVTRFFTANLGQPALCLGRRHVDMVMVTFLRVQRVLFDEGHGHGHDHNVTLYLKRKLSERFDVVDVPDGFLSFPIELGGLDVQNPIIPLMLVRYSTDKDPMDRIDRAFEGDEQDYEQAKKAYETGEFRSERLARVDEPFLSLAEYNQHCEETSHRLGRQYTRLLDVPVAERVVVTPEVKAGVSKTLIENPDCLAEDWNEMSPYLLWVLQLHGPDIMKRFGSLSLSDKKLLPIGLTSMLRNENIRWQG